MRKIKLQKIVIRELVDKPRKMYMDGTGHLEILSLPQGIENSRQFLLLRTDISQKTVVECPCIVQKVSISARELTVITNWSKSNAELFTQSIFHRRFYITCSTKKIKNKPEETSPRSFSGRIYVKPTNTGLLLHQPVFISRKLNKDLKFREVNGQPLLTNNV